MKVGSSGTFSIVTAKIPKIIRYDCTIVGVVTASSPPPILYRMKSARAKTGANGKQHWVKKP